jgi:uncharacterized membrane protein
MSHSGKTCPGCIELVLDSKRKGVRMKFMQSSMHFVSDYHLQLDQNPVFRICCCMIVTSSSWIIWL